MEMINNRYILLIYKVCCGLLLLTHIQSCTNSGEVKTTYADGIQTTEYPLFTLTPDFSINSVTDSLGEQYPRFRNGKEFPFVGILEVDGKAYRFMGSDSLRTQMIVPVSTDSSGWSGKYSFLFPDKGWEQPEFDDSQWEYGKAMFGEESVADVHTCWVSEHIYVRRIFTLSKAELQNRRLYIRYTNDDELTLYLNGQQVINTGWWCNSNALQLIPEEVVANMNEGENIIAAHCWNRLGTGLIDFGIYAENTSNRGADVAHLKSVNMGATQTHYVFQCGKVKLMLDFIAPLLPHKPDLLGCPVNYLAYRIKSLDEQPHTVKISFDLDQEWTFGKTQTTTVVDGDWKIVQTGVAEQKIFAGKESAGPSWGYLYMGMKGRNVTVSDHSGHILISQELGEITDASDKLLIGFDELCSLQYFGENLRPYWNRDGKRTMEEELKKAWKQHQTIQTECDRIDDKWANKAMATGGIKFAEHYIPSYRNIMSSYRLAETPDGKPIYFAYLVGSAEESHTLAPKLLFFERTDLLKALLNPVFDYSERGKWVKKYPAHDVGTYPVSIVQVSEKDKPVADAADMLIMTESIVNAEENNEYAKQHWQQLSQWGEYLSTMAEENEYRVDTLVNINDDRVKKVFGLSAYQRLLKRIDESGQSH